MKETMTTDTPAAAPITAERIAHLAIERGAKYPYDASDAWWVSSGKDAPPAVDWAHAAARGILHDLNDRRGIKHAFREIDEDVRKEMVAAHAAIIRAALSVPVAAQPAASGVSALWVEEAEQLADNAINAHATWFAECALGELSNFHMPHLESEKDAAREALRAHLSTALTGAATKE
jgi:hypothetical protein